MVERSDSIPPASALTTEEPPQEKPGAKRRSRRWFLSVSAGTSLAAGAVISSGVHAQTTDGSGMPGHEHDAHVAQAQQQPAPSPQGQPSTPQASQVSTTQGFTYFN